MKRIRHSFFITSCLLLAATIPATAAGPMVMATPSNAVQSIAHLGTLDLTTGLISPPADATEALGDIIWDNSNPSGWFSNNMAAPTQELLDTGDLPSGTYVGGFQIGFCSDATGTVALRYSFYENNNFDTLGNVLVTNSGAPAAYDIVVNDLPGPGCFTLDIVLPNADNFLITGADLDGFPGTDWGWGFTITDPGNATFLGPILSDEAIPAGAPGREDNLDRYDPAIADGGTFSWTFWYGGTPFAQMYMLLTEGSGPPIVQIPTVSTIGSAVLVTLLVGLSLAVMRRRRQTI